MNIDEKKMKVVKLSPKSGDLIVITLNMFIDTDECFNQMKNYGDWLSLEFPGVKVTFLHESQRIECLTEEDMLKLGYVRIDPPLIKEGG